jgi:hypothetical protein
MCRQRRKAIATLAFARDHIGMLATSMCRQQPWAVAPLAINTTQIRGKHRPIRRDWAGPCPRNAGISLLKGSQRAFATLSDRGQPSPYDTRFSLIERYCPLRSLVPHTAYQLPNNSVERNSISELANKLQFCYGCNITNNTIPPPISIKTTHTRITNTNI